MVSMEYDYYGSASMVIMGAINKVKYVAIVQDFSEQAMYIGVQYTALCGQDTTTRDGPRSANLQQSGIFSFQYAI